MRLSTFAERKAARIASGPIKYKFNVIAPWPFHGEIIGSFNSKKEANEFAFRQIGSSVGNTKAQQALFRNHYKTDLVPDVEFSIQRVEVEP